MKTDPLKYLDLIPKARAGENLRCPYCYADGLLYDIEEGDSPGKGFVVFECTQCKRVVHFSRIKF